MRRDLVGDLSVLSRPERWRCLGASEGGFCAAANPPRRVLLRVAFVQIA